MSCSSAFLPSSSVEASIDCVETSVETTFTLTSHSRTGNLGVCTECFVTRVDSTGCFSLLPFFCFGGAVGWVSVRAKCCCGRLQTWAIARWACTLERKRKAADVCCQIHTQSWGIVVHGTLCCMIAFKEFQQIQSLKFKKKWHHAVLLRQSTAAKIKGPKDWQSFAI